MSEENKDYSEKNQDAAENGGGAGEHPENKAEPGETSHTGQHLPKINFATFIFSLHSSVLSQLGLLEDPSTGKKTRNLIGAKQTIDILGMLEEKTRGNLTQEEEGMLKNMLYDVRILYVKENE